MALWRDALADVVRNKQQGLLAFKQLLQEVAAAGGGEAAADGLDVLTCTPGLGRIMIQYAAAAAADIAAEAALPEAALLEGVAAGMTTKAASAAVAGPTVAAIAALPEAGSGGTAAAAAVDEGAEGGDAGLELLATSSAGALLVLEEAVDTDTIGGTAMATGNEQHMGLKGGNKKVSWHLSVAEKMEECSEI